MKRIAFPLVLLTVSFSSLIHAAPIYFGALSSDDDGSSEIIVDDLNDYHWLRWDVLAGLTYQQTLDAVGTSGVYAGWNIAGLVEAQQLSNALLVGLSNDCTIVPGDSSNCNSDLPDLRALLGDDALDAEGRTHTVFLSTDGIGKDVGLMSFDFRRELGLQYLRKDNDAMEFFRADQVAYSWLLFRPQNHVSAPTNLTLMGLGLAIVGYRQRKQKAIA